MGLSIVIGGLILLFVVASASARKIANPDPLAVLRIAEQNAARDASDARVLELHNKMFPDADSKAAVQEWADSLGNYGENWVQTPAQVARLDVALQIAMHGRAVYFDSEGNKKYTPYFWGMSGYDRWVTAEAGREAYRLEQKEEAEDREANRAEWEATLGPSRAQLPYDPRLAEELASGVASHLREFRGWYVPEVVAQFQAAAGLYGVNGFADGVYGGRTMGALCYFLSVGEGGCDESVLPTPIYHPKWMVKYEVPEGDQI